MIIKQKDYLFYMTRRNYGSTIGIFVKKENEETVYSFLPGRIREDISVPEKNEDKKMNMVISAIKELMVEKNSDSLTVKLYNKKIKFLKNESTYDMYNKIFAALIEGASEKILRNDIKIVLENGLRSGEIDVF